MKVTKRDFQKAIDKDESLTSMGTASLWMYRMHHNLVGKPARERLAIDRKRFINDFEQFKTCCEWLPRFRWIKTPQIDSNYLHLVVKKLSGRYVSNGALIAAVYHLGLPYKEVLLSPSPNILLAVSKKCPLLKQARNVV